jgi:hypothetical protein
LPKGENNVTEGKDGHDALAAKTGARILPVCKRLKPEFADQNVQLGGYAGDIAAGRGGLLCAIDRGLGRVCVGPVITKRLLDLMNAEMKLHSVVNHGSTFYYRVAASTGTTRGCAESARDYQEAATFKLGRCVYAAVYDLARQYGERVVGATARY